VIRFFDIEYTLFYSFQYVENFVKRLLILIITKGGFMPNKGEIYKCELCGNVVKVLEPGGGALVCCGEDMQLLSDEEAKAYS
jgi:desulfoferrodoxin-like iron-binding protein